MLLVLLGAGSLVSGIARLLIGPVPTDKSIAAIVGGAVFIGVGFAIDQRKPKRPRPD
jgi:hypothetical protein